MTPAEREEIAAELNDFARRLRALADRDSDRRVLDAARHVANAAAELDIEVSP